MDKIDINLLLSKYNNILFQNRLPIFNIKWSDKMMYNISEIIWKENIIKLSSKLIRDESKLEEVLKHELCHLAVRYIDKSTEKHGILFKQWCEKCNIPFYKCDHYCIRAWKCLNCNLVLISNVSLKSYYHKLCGCYHFIEIPCNEKTKGIKVDKNIKKEHLIKIKDDAVVEELKIKYDPYIEVNTSLPPSPAIPSLESSFPKFIKFNENINNKPVKQDL